MVYHTIRTAEDIENFMDRTNGLHDGYIIGVQYANPGITKIPGGYRFRSEQTKLTVQILVTSIYDAVVEIVFEDLWEWQIQDNQWDITDTTVMLSKGGGILWADDVFTTMDKFDKKGSYAMAGSMKWRFVE